MRSRIKQFLTVLSDDKKFRDIGFKLGEYLFWFYRTRLNEHLPRLFPARIIDICLNDRKNKQKKIHVKLRIEYNACDIKLLKDIFGDLEYWNPSLLPAKRFLDLGAYIGFVSLWFSLLSPETEFACVEPDPRNLALLRENLNNNKLKAKIFQCAIDSKNTNAEFTLNVRPSENTLLQSIENIGLPFFCSNYLKKRICKKVNIKTCTIDNILDKLGWEKVDVIKMDIEGAEYNVFKSCESWIKRVGKIVLEIHCESSTEKIREIIHPFGLMLRCIGNKNKRNSINSVYIIERKNIEENNADEL